MRGTIPHTELPRLVPLWATGALADYRRSRLAWFTPPTPAGSAWSSPAWPGELRPSVTRR
ncbi:hypothetical protein ACIBJF_46695 [Streptomyces sp. NPDC050743]|uniref:hypothetical protein n=1 Tax=Streptomyces sp. NPDC050743 TaxID=3365634 RepID=UPI0037A241A4